MPTKQNSVLCQNTNTIKEWFREHDKQPKASTWPPNSSHPNPTEHLLREQSPAPTKCLGVTYHRPPSEILCPDLSCEVRAVFNHGCARNTINREKKSKTIQRQRAQGRNAGTKAQHGAWQTCKEREKHKDLNTQERNSKETDETNQGGTGNPKWNEMNKGMTCKEKQTQEVKSSR